MVWFSLIITNYYYYLLQLLVSDPSYTVKSLKANFLTNCRYSKTNYYNLLAYLKVNKQSWNLVGCLGNPSVLVCCFLSSYKLQGQVPSCELVISNLVARTKLWSLWLVPQIQTSLNFLDKFLQLVSRNALIGSNFLVNPWTVFPTILEFAVRFLPAKMVC